VALESCHKSTSLRRLPWVRNRLPIHQHRYSLHEAMRWGGRHLVGAAACSLDRSSILHRLVRHRCCWILEVPMLEWARDGRRSDSTKGCNWMMAGSRQHICLEI